MNSILFTYSTIIKESYLDSFWHMNNATYLELFEEARWDFVNKNNYGIPKIQETGLAPIILEIKLRFIKELCLREKITIESQVVFHKNKITKILQKMIRDEEICCEAEFTMGLFDTHKRKLVLPTQEWLRAIGLEPEK
jgi:thioesterase-3